MKATVVRTVALTHDGHSKKPLITTLVLVLSYHVCVSPAYTSFYNHPCLAGGLDMSHIFTANPAVGELTCSLLIDIAHQSGYVRLR